MAMLNDDQVVEVIDTINIFDTIGDGKFPVDSIIDCLRSLGLNPLQTEVAKIVKDIKEYHHETRVDIEDFLPIYEYFLKKKKPTFKDLCDGLKALNPIEAEKGGTIAAKDMKIGLTTIGDSLTQQECSYILDQVTDCRKQVSIEKLVKLVMSDENHEEDAHVSHVSVLQISNAHISQQTQQGSKAVFKLLD